MKNHVYTFNGTLKRQTKGRSIGLELTGVLVQIFMLRWDERFKEAVKELGLPLYLYKRYVDDINCCGRNSRGLHESLKMAYWL